MSLVLWLGGPRPRGGFCAGAGRTVCTSRTMKVNVKSDGEGERR